MIPPFGFYARAASEADATAFAYAIYRDVIAATGQVPMSLEAVTEEARRSPYRLIDVLARKRTRLRP